MNLKAQMSNEGLFPFSRHVLWSLHMAVVVPGPLRVCRISLPWRGGEASHLYQASILWGQSHARKPFHILNLPHFFFFFLLFFPPLRAKASRDDKTEGETEATLFEWLLDVLQR